MMRNGILSAAGAAVLALLVALPAGAQAGASGVTPE